MLTAYNGVARTYDPIGNLLTDGTWTYTWQNGRELASMTDGTTTWNYTYDTNGMRTSRTNGTKTYNYVYNGSQLTQMTVGNDTLYFTYGLLGPTTVTWNGETYYFVVNGQGDVTGIYDSVGTLVVVYNWDNAWGYNPMPEGSLASTLGTLNPLRYRGYVYDQEAGLYYLQSRYYDPEIGRFISADVVFDYDAGLQGFNLYIYCGNDPVNRIDISGADSSPIDDDVEDILEAKTLDGGGNPSPMPGSSAVVTNPIDAGYRYSVDLSQASNSSSFTGGIQSNGYSTYGTTLNPSNPQTQATNPKFTPDQQAVIALAKESKNGLSLSEAELLVGWAHEYKLTAHMPMTHPERSGYWANRLHINILKYHIPVLY